VRGIFLFCAIFLTVPSIWAQPSSPLAGTTVSRSREIANEKDYHFIGDVEMAMDDTTLFADDVWYYSEENRAVATGNVLYVQGSNRISADRVEMNTETRLGTFFNAWGVASLDPRTRSGPAGGVAPPPLTGQETDIYFFGDTVEKAGPRKYRISNGGFTTCVQPSPRWELHAGTVVLNIDDYTLLRNAIFRVKDVPVFYLPILYYPTKEEGRATGFLLPTYGSSALRGQTISNAFFWAIDRSQDATIMHDWFSKAGNGYGTEYRYASLGGDGNLKGYLLDETQTSLTGEAGPRTRSFEVKGGLNQRLAGNFRAQARVDYFSSVATMQTFHSDVYESSRNSRSYGGNVSGAWRGLSMNATFDRREYFTGQENSVLTGTAPRISVSRGDRPLYRNAAAYFSMSSEFVQFDRQSRTGDAVTDTGLARFDVSPQIRYPFKRWQWFTINSTATWRNTFYTRSLTPPDSAATQQLVDDSLNRQYLTLAAQMVGPVLNKVWNTPESGYAERFKHTIEPFLNIQRTTPIDDFQRIVHTDGIDRVVGNATSYTYGLNNRIYAKRRSSATGPSQAQEILNVELRQSYYSDEQSAQFDLQYQTGYNSPVPSNFSPLALTVRATPARALYGTLRADFDARHKALRTMSVSAQYNLETRLQTGLTWSRRYFIEGLPGFNDPNRLDHSINLDARTSTRNNRLGGQYSMNFDVQQGTMRSQRMTGFYNAQCCGIAFEYQTFDYGGRFAVNSDQRFFMSFTLAGLGNFSPFSGALSGVPR
jgi:LPS-assembly protein